jgi:hypothetical protein
LILWLWVPAFAGTTTEVEDPPAVGTLDAVPAPWC